MRDPDVMEDSMKMRLGETESDRMKWNIVAHGRVRRGTTVSAVRNLYRVPRKAGNYGCKILQEDSMPSNCHQAHVVTSRQE